MTLVVDHGCANLFSIGNALRHIGASYRLSVSAADIDAADRIILPGVGAFGDVMKAIRDRNLIAPLQIAARRNIPILGICVGMQVLATVGEEFGRHEGLNLIAGSVRKLPDAQESGDVRIPNVGWRPLNILREVGGISFDGFSGAMTYFTHSYGFFAVREADVVATISINGVAPAAVVRSGSVTGFQFHPEKSGPQGLELIRNFVNAG